MHHESPLLARIWSSHLERLSTGSHFQRGSRCDSLLFLSVIPPLRRMSKREARAKRLESLLARNRPEVPLRSPAQPQNLRLEVEGNPSDTAPTKTPIVACRILRTRIFSLTCTELYGTPASRRSGADGSPLPSSSLAHTRWVSSWLHLPCDASTLGPDLGCLECAERGPERQERSQGETISGRAAEAVRPSCQRTCGRRTARSLQGTPPRPRSPHSPEARSARGPSGE